VDAVRDHPRRLMQFSPAAVGHLKTLRAYLHENLYNHAALRPDRDQGVQVIQNLFQFYLQDPARLPRFYAEQSRQTPPHRVICDYIAGMTDSYIQKLHQELLGSLPGAEAPGDCAEADAFPG
jgi:dGTPase